MKIKQWLTANTHDLINKTIAITGSTGTLATTLIKELIKLNCNFIFINRNKEKTQQQINSLSQTYTNTIFDFVECDLSNFENVKSATNLLKEKHIDILYLCAGAYNIPRHKTNLGYDNVFQINFLSQYYIAKELLSNLISVDGKIVLVSSIAHNYSKIDMNDIDFSTRKKHSKVYGNAKRFLTFSLMELCRKEGVNLSIVHPGVTLTEMTNHYPKAINWLVKIGIKMFFPSSKKSSLSLIKGVFDSTEYKEWIGPELMNVWGFPSKKEMKIEDDEIKQIFEISEKIYGNIKNEKSL